MYKTIRQFSIFFVVLLMCITVSFAQTNGSITVTGTVVDEKENLLLVRLYKWRVLQTG